MYINFVLQNVIKSNRKQKYCIAKIIYVCSDLATP